MSKMEHTQERPVNTSLIGEGLKVSREHALAIGKYNVDNKSLFSIAYGESDTERKNVFEVNETGDVYIDGVITSKQMTDILGRIDRLEKRNESLKHLLLSISEENNN